MLDGAQGVQKGGPASRRWGGAGVLLALLVATVAAPAAAGQADSGPAQETDAIYRIGGGDVLEIIVWKEPELSRSVAVRADGMITVPLLGDVQAAERTPADLASSLQTEFKRFVETPQVTVGLADPKSCQFYVLGKVVRPGAFALVGTMSVLHALALAGGFQEYAKTDRIVIIRRTVDGQQVVPVDYKKLEDGSDLTQNQELVRGDTIIVP